MNFYSPDSHALYISTLNSTNLFNLAKKNQNLADSNSKQDSESSKKYLQQ